MVVKEVMIEMKTMNNANWRLGCSDRKYRTLLIRGPVEPDDDDDDNNDLIRVRVVGLDVVFDWLEL